MNFKANLMNQQDSFFVQLQILENIGVSLWSECILMGSPSQAKIEILQLLGSKKIFQFTTSNIFLGSS